MDTRGMTSEESATPDMQAVQRAFAAVSNGDFDAGLSAFAADAVWESVGLGTSFEGVEAIRGFLEDWVGRYESYEIELDEVLDLGNGVVFIRSGQSGRPAGSPGGVRLPREVMVHVLVWEHDTVTRVVSSGDTPEARADAERLARIRG